MEDREFEVLAFSGLLVLYFGSWGGGLAGIMATPICVAVSTTVQWVRRRASPAKAPAPSS